MNNKLNGLPVATLVKSRRRRKRVNGYVVPRGLPSYFPNAPGDQATIDFKFTNIIEVAASAVSSSGILYLGVGSSSPGLTYLSNYSALFAANAGCYTRFMVEALDVELRATGVGGNANTFVAASYIPTTSSLDGIPSSLSEVSQAIHYCESALGTIGHFKVRPCDYYNDWRIINNADDNDKQCGAIQFYGSGSNTSSAVTAGVLTVSGRIHFCGLRH